MKTQLIDTLYSDYNYTDYLDFCEANEREPQPEYSNDYFNWVNNERQFAIEDFFDGDFFSDVCACRGGGNFWCSGYYQSHYCHESQR